MSPALIVALAALFLAIRANVVGYAHLRSIQKLRDVMLAILPKLDKKQDKS